MIQTGDPLGTGSETGYKFKDEINDLRFDEAEFWVWQITALKPIAASFYYARCYTLARRKHTILGMW
jgi:cyclophilin family peptidyl-prolyl cis-trans isomerase